MCFFKRKKKKQQEAAAAAAKAKETTFEPKKSKEAETVVSESTSASAVTEIKSDVVNVDTDEKIIETSAPIEAEFVSQEEASIEEPITLDEATENSIADTSSVKEDNISIDVDEEKVEDEEVINEETEVEIPNDVKVEDEDVPEDISIDTIQNEDKSDESDSDVVATDIAVEPVATTTETTQTTTKVAPHGKFVIKKTTKGNYVYKLFSYNNRVIAIGAEQYGSLISCKNGIASVIKNAAVANIEDQTLQKWEEKKCPKWQIYSDKSNEIRFRLISSNGNIIATTNDGYMSRASAKKGIEAIIRAINGADIMRIDDLW